MYGVAFALDRSATSTSSAGCRCRRSTPEEIDRILGCVLTYSDDNFDRALELGFTGSIQREWDWRVKRGESLANLQPFARILPDGGQRE